MKTKFLLALLFISNITFAQQVPTTGLTSRFDFNGNLTDAVSNTNATASNTISYVNDPKHNPNSAVTIPTSGTLQTTHKPLNSNSASISFWLKKSSNNNKEVILKTISAANNSAGLANLGFRIVKSADNNLELETSNGDREQNVAGVDSNIFNNRWHLITINTSYGYSNGAVSTKVNLYINSILKASTTIFGTATVFNAGSRAANIKITNATIDQLLTYNRKLSGAEITNLSFIRPIAYVNKNATGENDGSSWANAYTNLEDALSLNSSLANQEIWVAKGTYKPTTTTTNITIIDRNKYFGVNKSNIKIYGGFDGTETNLSDRDATKIHTTNATILSGDLAGNDGNSSVDFNTSERSDNSFRILYLHNSSDNFLLDGVTISGGHANSYNSLKNNGAGISKDKYVKNITLNNCIFKDNVAIKGGAAFSGVFEASNGFFRINRCRFINNVATYGASIYTYVNREYVLDLTVSNSLFDSNTTKDQDANNQGYYGSAGWYRAIYQGSTLIAKFINNTYVNNKDIGTRSGLDENNIALIGVGAANNTSASSMYYNNIFWNNKTVNNANTIFASHGAYDNAPSSITVKNNTDEGNFRSYPANQSFDATNNNTNPSFVNFANKDYRLSSNSPLINTGINTNFTGSLDLLGNDRVVNTTIDRGAYEYDATASTNDVVFTNNVNIYPNPVNTTLTIKTDKITVKGVSIYNLLGKKVLQTKQQTINVSNLAKGMYILKVQSADNKTATKKFFKQ